MRIVALDEASRKDILADLLKRDPNNYTAYSDTVQEIVDTVKRDRDAAVFSYTEQFDHAVIDASTIRVTEEEIKEAMRAVEPGLLEVMKRSMKNIRAEAEDLQLVRQQTGRNDSGTEDHSPFQRRGLRSRRQGGVSVLRSYEHHSRRGCRRRKNRHGNPSGQRRKGQSRDAYRGPSCRGD